MTKERKIEMQKIFRRVNEDLKRLAHLIEQEIPEITEESADELLTLDEAAGLLGVSISTVSTLATHHKLTIVKTNPRRVAKTEVLARLARIRRKK